MKKTLKPRNVDIIRALERIDEGECWNCGAPVLIGDNWYVDRDHEEAYCSYYCVERSRLRRPKITDYEDALLRH